MGTRFVPRPQGFVEINAPGGVVNRGVAKAAGKLRDDAKRFTNVDKGALRQSIRSYPVKSSATESVYRVGTDVTYAIYQHEGVRGPVLPRRAKALRFKPKGSGVFIFRASTRGFPGTHFLTRAAALVRSGDFT